MLPEKDSLNFKGQCFCKLAENNLCKTNNQVSEKEQQPYLNSYLTTPLILTLLKPTVSSLHPNPRGSFGHSVQFSSVQFSSVTQLCLTLCNPMNHSTPGLPVHHQLPEFTQTHVHRVDNAIQPSHPLSSPSPPALNPSQHQGLFK